jgi:SAM-dependent methyltransferase
MTRTEAQTLSFSASYAQVYDAVYHDKPYASEVDLVLSAVKRHAAGQRIESVVELACGTGRHALELSRRGLTVLANDISAEMVARARERNDATVLFSTEPMQTVSANRTFDLATAFYTAMGYLVEPVEVDRLLRNLRRLLRPGGFFFADLWNGAKMATQFSPHRERTVEHEGLAIKRTSDVRSLPEKNALEVHFTFDVREQASGATRRFDETHQVRYHTGPELLTLLPAHGFRVVEIAPFFDESATVAGAWNFYVLAQREGES